MGWLTNAKGTKDPTLTVAVAGAFVILFKILLHGASITLKDKSFSLGTIDAATATGVLAALWGTYWARRRDENIHEREVMKLNGNGDDDHPPGDIVRKD